MDFFKQNIRKILLENTVHDYYNNLTTEQTKKNLKNFGLLEKELNGGGKDLHINYNDETYTFTKIDDLNSSTLYYVLYSTNKKDECVVIIINKELKIANINNISSYGLKCSNTIINEQGKHLIKITINLLKKYKNKFNIEKIFIKDHSFLSCKSIKNTIILADLYILKYGHTFYGSFGFLPYHEHIDDKKELNKQYNHNLKKISELLVNDSYLIHYLNKYSTKYDIDISDLIKYAEKNKNKPLSEIIKLISSRSNFDNYCHMLKYIIPKLFYKNRLYSFYNKTFEFILSKDM